jgi:hypothetical protein
MQCTTLPMNRLSQHPERRHSFNGEAVLNIFWCCPSWFFREEYWLSSEVYISIMASVDVFGKILQFHGKSSSFVCEYSFLPIVSEKVGCSCCGGFLYIVYVLAGFFFCFGRLNFQAHLVVFCFLLNCPGC